MLEANLTRVLSSDRIAPRIFEAAKSKFDSIPSKDCPQVLTVAARIFTHSFLIKQQNDLQIYCPTKPAPLRVDCWLLRKNLPLPLELPISAKQAEETKALLDGNFPLLCVSNWTVSYANRLLPAQTKAQSESDCLAKIQGWSVCFREEKLPDDYGRLLEDQAKEMARQAGTLKRETNKRGPKGKVIPLADRMREIYADGIPDKSAKEIERDLKSSGMTNFCETTLRKAIAEAKKQTIPTT